MTKIVVFKSEKCELVGINVSALLRSHNLSLVSQLVSQKIPTKVLSGTARGRQLYALMADGKPVPNEYVNDLLAETMVKKAASKVIYILIYSKMVLL